ncbi:hypothetical protein EJD97_023913 [Solanum chilense]|uniref:Uncharacterized protein n=1 Tax=Solanum chilense TaxID=4083 RepID=A0A6N2ARL3_SOLCI|nr:hypothetical protein EJD97_023913 [Solanum chilense]
MGAWVVHFGCLTLGFRTLCGAFKASLLKLREHGWLPQDPGSFLGLVGSLRASLFKIREPRGDEGTAAQAKGAWVDLSRHRVSISLGLGGVLGASLFKWRSQRVMPQDPGTWVSLWASHLKHREPGCLSQGIVTLSLVSKVVGIGRRSSSSWQRPSSCRILVAALKASRLKLWELGWRTLIPGKGVAQGLGRRVSCSKSMFSMLRVYLGDSLKASHLKLHEPGFNAQGVVPQSLGASHAHFVHPYSGFGNFDGALMKSSLLILGGALKASSSCRHSSSFLKPCGALRESCLKLKELGWRAQGITPQSPGAQFLCLRLQNPCGALKPGCRAKGIIPQAPRAWFVCSPQAQGAWVACCSYGGAWLRSRRSTLSSRFLGGTLRTSRLLLWERRGAYGAAPQALAALVECSWTLQRPSSSRILVGELKASFLKLKELGWHDQGIAPVAPGVGGAQGAMPQAQLACVVLRVSCFLLNEHV